MLVRRAGHGAGVLHGQIYVTGGAGQFSNTVERFNQRTRKWEAMKNMRTGRCHHAVSVVANRLYVSGGLVEQQSPFPEMPYRRFQGSFVAERFDPRIGKRGEWEILPQMLWARWFHGAVTINGHVFTLGGLHGSDLSSMECFHPVAGQWKAQPPMLTARHGIAAAAMGGRLYVCGGESSEVVLNLVEIFDPVTSTWQSSPCMTSPRKKPIAAVISGQLYIIGGGGARGLSDSRDYPDSQRLTSAERYDHSKRKWVCLPPAPARRTIAAGASLAIA